MGILLTGICAFAAAGAGGHPGGICLGTDEGQSPTQVSGMGQVHLSPDGTHLLGLVGNQSEASMVELDPVSLAQTNITTIPTAGIEYANGFALANDGNVILNVAYSYGFAYGTFSHLVTPLSTGGGYTVDGGDERRLLRCIE